jgi:hypothetical protein
MATKQFKDWPAILAAALDDNDIIALQTAGNPYGHILVSELKKVFVGAAFVVPLPAGSWNFPNTNFASLEKISGSNGDIWIHQFSDGGADYLEAFFTLPDAIAGTVTIQINGFAATAVASKNVQFRLSHSARSAGESWDNAYADKNSGDLAISGTQDDWDELEFTETITNLGWSPGDKVRIQLKRIAASASDLVGNYNLADCNIIIPRI